MEKISPPPTMMTKWSSKSPDHKANRVRNNQRRHRARVKANITDLEIRLAEAQRQLLAAHARIEELAAEVERLQNSTELSSDSTINESEANLEPTINSQQILGSRCGEPPIEPRTRPAASFSCALQDLRAIRENDIAIMEPRETAVEESIKSPLGLHIMPTTDTWKQSAALSFVTQYNGSHLPPSKPGESTTTCLAAFGIIAQHNFSGVDDDTIRQWLQPGFRGPGQPGDECRVETHLLCSVMDYICPL